MIPPWRKLAFILGLSAFWAAGWALAPAVLAASAVISADSGRVHLSGTVQLINGQSFSVFSLPLHVVIVDTNAQRPLERRLLDFTGSTMSFVTSLLPDCATAFYFERAGDSVPVNSSAIDLGSNIWRDATGKNFRLTSCFNPPPPPVSLGEVRVENNGVLLAAASRQVELIDGRVVSLNSTALSAVIFGPSYYRVVNLSGNNDNFPVTEIPCGADAKWFYQTTFGATPVNSARLQPGNWVGRDATGHNFRTNNCWWGTSTAPPPVSTTNNGQVFRNGNLIQLQSFGGQLELVNGGLINTGWEAVDAVIFSPGGARPSVVVPLGSGLTFVRSALLGDDVWFYRRHSDGLPVNSQKIQPGSCVTRDATGKNFRLSC